MKTHPEEILFEKDRKEQIDKALDKLDERSAFVIRHYYGIDCDESKVIEIARILKLSRMRIWQIKKKAIRKLRHYTFSRSLRGFLE